MKLFLSCKKATELVEQKNDDTISFKNLLQLNLHLLICKACSNYQKQSLLINKIFKKHFNLSNNAKIDIIENKKLKEQIISKL